MREVLKLAAEFVFIFGMVGIFGIVITTAAIIADKLEERKNEKQNDVKKVLDLRGSDAGKYSDQHQRSGNK